MAKYNPPPPAEYYITSLYLYFMDKSALFPTFYLLNNAKDKVKVIKY